MSIMSRKRSLQTLLLAVVASAAVPVFAQAPAAAAIRPVPASAVQITDAFWAPRLEILRTVTIPAALQRLAETNRVDNFVRAAGAIKGDAVAVRRGQNPFEDADVYKVIEAASWTLAWHPDPALDKQLDDLIAKVAAAQEKDGYLYTLRTIDPKNPPALAGVDRWANEKADSFELSDLGYLYEAAVAHYQATGKKTLLDVATRSADLLDATFGADKKSIFSGHEGVELGLIDLSNATGEKKYLTLAKFFLDQRGPAAGAAPGRGARGNTNQSAQKAVDQTAATGNAVDGAALFAAMAAIGDPAYEAAVEKISDNAITRKLTITGGIGGNDNVFGQNFVLSNIATGNGAAASAAFTVWNERMLQTTGKSKYADQIERTLYNNLLAAVSTDGKLLIDSMPLESIGRNQRRVWPGQVQGNQQGAAAITAGLGASAAINAVRVLAAMPSYVYTTSENNIYVNLYVAGTATVKLQNGRTVKIEQTTKYPADGQIKLTITPDQPAEFTLNVRIPSWAVNDAGGDLYTFADAAPKEMVKIKIGAETKDLAASTPGANSYLGTKAKWAAGDSVELTLPMPVRRVKANDQVIDDKGHIALQRGPLIYALEAPDARSKVRNFTLPDDAILSTITGNAPIVGIVAAGQNLSMDDQDKLVHAAANVAAVPYFMWGNHGAAEMVVWIPTGDAGAVPLAAPNLSATARITTALRKDGTNAGGAAAKDGLEPRSSHDNSPLSHFDWWPDKSTAAAPSMHWVEYVWDAPQTISQTQVYWWDDSKNGGGCAAPASWKAFYKDADGKWQPVETADTYGVEDDKYNKVTFKPVKTTGLRLEIVDSTTESVGIQEWKVR